ncbi:tail length tape measure protein [Bacillus phage vB_BanS_Sophrita]|uniref:Tail tape measure protein n=1 Tax=Bacillus phage vB_BanS_Sophrita TaxID=2894790 RepID=A0AAE9CE17_9CAUD|nr:tail length tape measure protein [Bacillus phage vB_BanS_Sophrita]UGO50799.1 putative tail tape measure protein [Bacillus phage vB_BanS_Sophrita]
MAGSNDLNISLKAQVVKLKVELDAKGSKLPAQVNNISKMLANNPVKLKVKLDAKLTDLTKQMKAISTSLQSKPMKMKVELDVAGSATAIKKQMQDIYKTVDDFNKKYSAQVKKMNQQINDASKAKGKAQSNIPTGAPIGNFNNIKQYTNQIKEAQAILNGKFGDGIFKATQFKDAKGNLTGFVAELQKATGVVEKLKYSWNSKSQAFEVINRQTIDNTNKGAQQIQNTLKQLKSEINNLGKGSNKSALFNDLTKIKKALSEDDGRNFTKQMVTDLQNAIKAEQQLAQSTKSRNILLAQQAKLEADMKKLRETGIKAKSDKDTDFRNEFNKLVQQSKNVMKSEDPTKAMKDIRLASQALINDQNKVISKEKETQAVLKETIKLRQQLKNVLRTMPSDDSSNKLKRQMVTEAISATQQIKTYKQLADAKKNLQSISNKQWMDNDQTRAKSLIESLKSVQRQFETIGKTPTKLTNFMSMIDDRAKNKLSQNTQDIRNALTTYQRMLADEQRKIKAKEKEIRLGQDITAKFGGASQVKNIEQQMFGNGAMSQRAIKDLQNYISTVERAKVASISFGRDGVDQMGNRTRQMSVLFQGAGEHVRKVTYNMTEGSGKIRQASDEMVRNLNRNLSAWEKFKVMMQSAPVWMISQQAMMLPIQGLQGMVQEILKVDQALTELRRVASPNQNIDILFGNAVEMSGKLGNNIHDIMKGMNEFARTFGDFNERQLTAITETATLMSNVSDLTVEESQKSLVGTMNAFNIEAEDSIRIVDALNEVDNNYAISTKQLAEGLQKSASAGRTFGVGLEENIGHITAIGAVTMESGNIIGNSLKTIYSRMTTMKDSEATLRSVGIAMNTIGENGVKNVKPVANIIDELGKKWFLLSDAERQNIAVKLAGRHQLTRFLAMMNNYDMAVKATATAYRSQGSAMRENEKYMQSFEAKINKLKNGFTEMSLAMGKAFLSGGMEMVISGLAGIAKGVTTVTQSFGALSTIGLVIGAVMTRMGAFQNLFGRIGATVGVFKQGMREVATSTNGTATAMQKFQGGMNGVITTSTGGTTAFKALGSAVKGFGMSLLGMLGMGAVFFAIGAGVEFLIGKYQKAKQEQEALEKRINESVNAYRKSADGLEGLLSQYEKFEKAGESIKKGTREYDEFMIVQSKLAQAMPSMVASIDSEGQAHMKTSTELRKHLELTKELSRIKADATNKSFAKNMEDEAKALSKLVAEQEKLDKKRKETKTGAVDWKAGVGESAEERARKEAKYQMDSANLQVKIAEQTQKTTKAIQDQARAYLEAEGYMAKLGAGAQGVVDAFAKVNSDKIQDLVRKGAPQKEIQNMISSITKDSGKIGEVWANAFDKMSKGINKGTTEGQRAIDKIKADLGSIGKAIPDDLFKLDKNNSIDDVTRNLEGLIEVGQRVKSANGGTWQALAQDAQKYGLTARDAEQFVMKLGTQSQNAEIRTKALEQSAMGVGQAMDGVSEGVDGATGALKDYEEAILGAIDAQKELFGYKNEELGQLKGHLEAMKTAQLLYGENAKGTKLWADSGEKLSQFLGISKEQVYGNIDGLMETVKIMGDVGIKYDENGQAVLNWGDATDAQISRFKENVQKMGLDVDLLTGKTREAGRGIKETGDATGQAGALFNEAGQRVNQAGELINEAGQRIDEAGNLIDQAGDKANQGGDKVNQAGDKVSQAGDKIGQSGGKVDPFIAKIEELAQKSGTTGEQVVQGLQKINLADFSQVQAKSQELGLTMDEVIEMAKQAGAITPAEMAKIGNSGENLSLLENKMKNLGFDELTGKTGETATKVEGDMQRIGNSGYPLGLLETKMKNLGFDEATQKSGETATKIESDMSRAGNSGVNLAPLGSTLRTVQDAMGQTGSKAGEAGTQVQNGLNTMGNSGGSLGVLTGKLDEAKASMDSTKTNVETNVQGINQSFSTLGQGFDTNNRWKTTAQQFTETLQGMSKQSGSSAQEIQGHVNTISTAGQSLDGYRMTVDKVKQSMQGMATEVTGTATGLSQFGMAFSGAGQAMSGFQNSMSAVRTEMSSVVSDASNTASSLESVGSAMSSAGNGAGAFQGAMFNVSNACATASQAMASLGMAGAGVASGLASATQASNASAQASQNNASAKQNEASASQTSATASFNVANAKQTEASAIMSAISATQNMASAYSSMASAGISAVSSMIGAIMSYLGAVMTMASVTTGATSQIRGTFMGMVGTVVSGTGAMVSAHGSQASALNRVKDAANQAKSAVQGLNSTVSGAMTNLNNYIAKAQQASNVQVKAPSLPPLPTGATWTMQSLTNVEADNSGVANAITNFGSQVASTMGAFSANSGDSGSSGGDGGTSGTLQSSIYSGLNSYGEMSLFRASADDSDKLSDATPWSSYERSMKELDVTIKWMEAKMKSINKNTAEYRKMMNDVYQVEIKRWELLNADLWTKERRNEQIKRELDGLKNINSHTKEQREQYNKLWSEYESNLSSITSMRAEWQEFLDNWENRYAEILKEHVNAIVEEYTKGLEQIKSKVDDIDFKIEVAELTDPDNITKITNLYIEKAKQFQAERAKLEAQQRDLTLKLYEAQDKFGGDSQVAKDIQAEIDKVKEAWEDSTLDLLKTEQKIKDTRKDVADDGIAKLKNFYKLMKDMAVEAIDKEQDRLKKAHDEKMKLYDKEIDKINSIYDAKLKDMDDKRDEDNYQEELGNKESERAKLQDKIGILSKDTSVGGRKKLAEAQEELRKMDEEINKYKRERQDELLRKALEDQKEQELKEMEGKKEQADLAHEQEIDRLEKEKEAVTKKWDSMIEDEQRWAKMKDEFAKGNFQVLNAELTNMYMMLGELEAGYFNRLTDSWTKFGEEVKKQIKDIFGQDIDNAIFDNEALRDSANGVIGSNPYQMFEGEVLRPEDPARPMKPAPEPPPNPNPKPPTSNNGGNNNQNTKTPSKGQVSGVDANSYLNIRSAPDINSSVSRRILNGANVQILGDNGEWWKVRFSNSRGTTEGYANKKYIKAFDTGGYTGDDVPNEGALALLHKKEQVLNANDTKNIFNTVKLVDKIKSYIPDMKANNLAGQFASAGNISVNNNYELTVNIENMNGSKEQAKSVTSEIMKGLKKLGK